MRILLTGASGLIGSRVLRLLLDDARVDEVIALVHATPLRDDDPHACDGACAAPRERPRVAASRQPAIVRGDVTVPGFRLDARDRARLDGITHVVHAAADTTFSRPLAAARAVNTQGTAHTLDVARSAGARRLVHVSTAYVAGMLTGRIPETGLRPCSFVNAYEQSKHEAECLVRSADLDVVVIRPSTIVCDDVIGRVTQHNAVHRAFRVMHAGLAPMMPGSPETPVDFVTAAYVAGAVARITLADTSSGTYHLCAGDGAMPLGEMLERTFALWSGDDAWRRRGILPPLLTDIDTFRDFEHAVEETGDTRLAAVARSLTHFAPQMALPKRFDTARADAALGHSAPPVAALLETMLDGIDVRNVRAVAA